MSLSELLWFFWVHSVKKIERVQAEFVWKRIKKELDDDDDGW